jgi:hypothetical protein
VRQLVAKSKQEKLPPPPLHQNSRLHRRRHDRPLQIGVSAEV